MKKRIEKNDYDYSENITEALLNVVRIFFLFDPQIFNLKLIYNTEGKEIIKCCQ